MAVYAISDLHLSFGVNKPMDIFGGVWENYEEKLKENWNRVVKKEDTVLICGDISWATYLPESVKDFEYIDKLNGNKLILRGNHDYYFQTKTKQDNFYKYNKFNTLKTLHNNAIEVEDYIICGTRLWEKKDYSVYTKELGRLRISLEQGKKIREENLEKGIDKKIVTCIHYPPFDKEVINILKEYDVSICCYGHIHGEGLKTVKEGNIEGIEFKMVSIDYTNLNVVKL